MVLPSDEPRATLLLGMPREDESVSVTVYVALAPEPTTAGPVMLTAVPTSGTGKEALALPEVAVIVISWLVGSPAVVSTAVATPVLSVVPPLTGAMPPAVAENATTAPGTRLLFESLAIAVTVIPEALVLAADGNWELLTRRVSELMPLPPPELLLLLLELPPELELELELLPQLVVQNCGPPPPQALRNAQKRMATRSCAKV